jgi:murein DD-endopeptidase MepM/ murein hydrolase activator NlpD
MKSSALLWGGLLVGFAVVVASGPAAPALVEVPYAPVAGRFPLPVSSRYGWRTDPIKGTRSFHAGIDFPVPTGTEVYAPLMGVVVRIDRVGDGLREGNGNAVFLAASGYRWCFLHLSVVLVQVGQVVSRGQRLGLSGNTGRSTGPHLHLQVYNLSDQAINPEKLYPSGMFRASVT